MKNERLLQAIGNIDDELIAGATESKPTDKKTTVKWIAVAASFVLVISAICLNLPDNSQQTSVPPSNKELPMLTVTENTDSMGMGFEGYMAYDISDLTNANPWSDKADISTLPVYKNLYTYDINGDIPADGDKYTTELVNDIKSKTENMTGVRVEAFSGSVINVEFEPAAELDEKYNFGFYSSYKEMEKVAKYFKTEYSKIIDMEKPIINIYHGDYDIYGRQLYRIYFYEGKGNLEEQIINYHFNTVEFNSDDDGRLCGISIGKTDLSEKVGDYPVISSSKAKTLLFNGNYITTVPYTLTGNEKLAKTELVYRNGGTEKYFMPYYKFFIEIPDSFLRLDGLKNYGAYYVPAVEGEYILNMPVWDGSFN